MVVYKFLLYKHCMLSHFSRVQLFVTLWTVALQASPWHSPGKNTDVNCHALVQGIFLTQRSNPCLRHILYWQVGSLPVGYLGSPYYKQGHGNPLQYSCLENPTDRGAWCAIVHRVTESWTQLKQFSTHAHTDVNILYVA